MIPYTTRETRANSPFEPSDAVADMPLLAGCYIRTWGAYSVALGFESDVLLKRWIFYKPTYERMELVDREDLDSDPGTGCD